MDGRWVPRIVWLALGVFGLLGTLGMLGITIPDMGAAGVRLALVALGGGAAALLLGAVVELDMGDEARPAVKKAEKQTRARTAATSRGRRGRRPRARVRTKRRMLAPVG